MDMLAGDVLELEADGNVRRRHVGNVAAIIRPRRGPGFVVATQRAIGLASDDDLDTPVDLLPEVWSDGTLRMNEGACDPAGNFYFGSVAYDHAPGVAELYRLTPAREITKILGDITISNGLEWDPTGTRAYYVDTPTRRVDVFDWDETSGLHNRRPYVEVTAEGRPDGLTVDAEGGVWVALFGGGAVHRYGSGGVLDEVVGVGARQVTAVTFAGPELDRLVITTSRKDLPEGADPAAGALFTCEPSVHGLPIREFAG